MASPPHMPPAIDSSHIPPPAQVIIKMRRKDTSDLAAAANAAETGVLHPAYRMTGVKVLEKILCKAGVSVKDCYVLEGAVADATSNILIALGLNHDKQNTMYMNTYESLMIDMCSNLDSESSVKNNYLLKSILNGTIAISKIPSMTPQEWFPSRWEKQTAKEAAEVNIAVNGITEISTSIYTCGKCKKNQCSYRESQDRSSDEGSTLHIKCLVCGARWKLNN